MNILFGAFNHSVLIATRVVRQHELVALGEMGGVMDVDRVEGFLTSSLRDSRALDQRLLNNTFVDPRLEQERLLRQ